MPPPEPRPVTYTPFPRQERRGDLTRAFNALGLRRGYTRVFDEPGKAMAWRMSTMTALSRSKKLAGKTFTSTVDGNTVMIWRCE